MIAEGFFTSGGAQMDKIVQAYSAELAAFRTGRASTKLLEDVEVDAYGSKMRLKELGTISIPEPSMLVVQPWDKSVLQAIDKAIRTSGLNLSPVAESGVLRVPVPPLSEERRKEMAKAISKKAEDARVSIRNVRHELINKLAEMKKKNEATEDEEKRGRDRVQKLTDASIKKIDETTVKKIEELQRV